MTDGAVNRHGAREGGTSREARAPSDPITREERKRYQRDLTAQLRSMPLPPRAITRGELMLWFCAWSAGVALGLLTSKVLP